MILGQAIDKEAHIQSIYGRIINMAILVHASYIVLFLYLGCLRLTAYNVLSTLFYLGAQCLVRRSHYRLTVTAVHGEVSCFVILSALHCGWQLGTPLYLMALASLVYFCPFTNRRIPYWFSVGEIIIFLALWLTADAYEAHVFSASAYKWLYVYNASVSFGIILLAAFLSGVSAKVSRQELVAENQNLRTLINYDQLTGVLSRRSFEQLLQRTRSQSVYLVMGDIDDFKCINDTYGHLAGDYVLQSVARLMRSACEPVGEVCRFGGEEFLILLRLTALEEAYERIEALRAQIAGYRFSYEGQALSVTMTFGLAACAPTEDVAEAIRRADEALYVGKSLGKNQVAVSEL